METFGTKSESAVEKSRAQQFDVLNPKQFLSDFKAEVDSITGNDPFNSTKPHKVYIQAMLVRFFGQSTKEMFNVLKKATENGLDVRLHIDSYEDTIVSAVRNAKGIFRKKKGLSEEGFVKGRRRFLAKKGAAIEKVNPIKNLYRKIIFIKGHNHIKIALVDGISWIGGMNFAEGEFNKEDFVVKITDPRITDVIAKQFSQVNENRPKEDYEVKCTDKTTILVDSGKPGQSIILDKAIEAVNSAQKRILLSSQLMPEGNFMKALDRARKRGVEVVCLQSDPKTEELDYRTLNTFNRLRAKTQPIPITFIANKKVHAKLLIADDTAFFGSHNFSETGVRSGTEEFAIKTTEPIALTNLENYFRNLQNKA